jgi:hypothetical protein
MWQKISISSYLLQTLEHVARRQEPLGGAEELALLEAAPDLLGRVNQEFHAAA